VVQCQESRHCLDTVTRQTIRHIWSANLRSHYFRCSDPGCCFTGKGDSSIHSRIRRPGSLADGDFPVRRSHQVHGRSAFPTQPKVLDSTFRMVSSRSRVHMVIVCLNHEDLPTAKIVEWYVAGWISHVPIIVTPETPLLSLQARGVRILRGAGPERAGPRRCSLSPMSGTGSGANRVEADLSASSITGGSG
jgi:hypothetical protein